VADEVNDPSLVPTKKMKIIVLVDFVSVTLRVEERHTGEGVGEGDECGCALGRREAAGVPLNHVHVVPLLGSNLLACLLAEALAQIHHVHGLEAVQRQVLGHQVHVLLQRQTSSQPRAKNRKKAKPSIDPPLYTGE